jgi:hypothetical protein
MPKYLWTAEEMDAAARKSIDYRAPGSPPR